MNPRTFVGSFENFIFPKANDNDIVVPVLHKNHASMMCESRSDKHKCVTVLRRLARRMS